MLSNTIPTYQASISTNGKLHLTTEAITTMASNRLERHQLQLSITFPNRTQTTQLMFTCSRSNKTWQVEKSLGFVSIPNVRQGIIEGLADQIRDFMNSGEKMQHWCTKGDLDQIASAVKSGVDLSYINGTYANVFHLAARQGQYLVFKTLLENCHHKFSPQFAGEILHTLVRNQDWPDLVELTLLRGASPEAIEPVDHQNVLQVVCQNGQFQSLLVLLPYCKKILDKAEGNEQCSPLWLAARYGHVEIVEMLCTQKGIDLNKKDVNGDTPLSISVETSYVPEEITRQLISVGSDVNLTGSDGIAVIFKAIANRQIANARLMISKGSAVVNIKDQDDCSLLSRAVQTSNLSLFTNVLSQLKKELFPKEGALTRSVTNAQLPLQHTLSMVDRSKKSALYYATELKIGGFNQAQFLLENGADFRWNNQIYSPLCSAMNSDNQAVFSMLMGKIKTLPNTEAAALLKTKDASGLSPYDIAVRVENPVPVEMKMMIRDIVHPKAE
ncbi:hypothetical protein D5018_11480 [Parashewanella curva]|uniref:Uncharacterized protein n=1 Tax=Parashewanella curva TaxID=2338552 RepID=A0A3L8PYL3_9GAMM|nr:ankyrin repeat domain-containing protein [Parashewanella curva]RLV59568.1 hypothetical protein D5018_11480 [Parashewanella curva]